MLSQLTVTAYVLLFAATWLHAAQEQWQLVLEEDFDSPECLRDWSLDGPADVSVTPDGKLRIKTQDREVDGQRARCSVLWHRTPVWGDLRIEFDAKAERKSRCLFLFNARATGKDRSIFTWTRPLAAYADYAYEKRIELYSMGGLRSDQKGLNLRHLGGSEVTDEWSIASLRADPRERARLSRQPPFKQALAPHVQRYKQIWQNFQDVSIIASHDAAAPVFADPEKFYHVAITVRGAKVDVRVDGATIVDFADAARIKAPLAGGYLGFRNFVPTEAQYDNVRVYRLAR